MQKYLTIYHDLVHKIQKKYWQEDELLPSENELTKRYNTSRETVRKALNLLAQDGFIQKIRGKGSVVIKAEKLDFPVSGIRSFKELATSMKLNAETSVEDLSLIDPDSHLQSKLQLSLDDKVWKVSRARKIANEKVILDKDFLSENIVPKLTEAICKDSIYDYLENELGLPISFAHKEIIVEEPTDEDRGLLDFEGFSNIVVIKSVVYLSDATPFQYTESRHRPDKFRFVDFARRMPN